MTELSDKVQEAVAYLNTRIVDKPLFGVVCGSGLGGLAELVEDAIIIDYSDIPWFAKSTVHGHKGRLVFGKLSGKDVVCMQGRLHPYEGFQPWQISFPIKVMRMLGVELVMVTCAAGGIDPDFSVGDVMIIKDHISFPVMGGFTPLIGPNDERFGVRFPSLQNAYDRELRAQLKQCAVNLGFGNFIKEGILCNVFGPTYETTAELRMMRLFGISAVGMSTIPEVITARHAGMKVIGFALVTNKCSLEYEDGADLEGPNHSEVLETSMKKTKDLEQLALEFFRSV